ncbi:MAG: hypothetical protein MJE77_44755 [Proteobacteria bacterium]|nr:hypothetical protein [Pseudomonadota bacterium]
MDDRADRVGRQNHRNPLLAQQLMHFWLLALAVACSAARPSSGEGKNALARTPGPCAGRLLIRDRADLARISSCRAIRGHLDISGAALNSARSLATIRAVEGSVHIGPTLALVSVDGLSGLTAIEGSLAIDSNLRADGVYLPSLRRLAGDLSITSNTAISGVNAPVLELVGGDLLIAGNPSLVRIDVSQLRSVSGTLDISSNAVLDTVHAPALVRVGSEVILDDNPALSATSIRALRTGLAGQ